MNPLAIPHLTLQGFPRDIGHAHGEAFRPLVRDNVETYFAIFAHYAGLSRDQVLSRASLFVPVIEQFDADLFDEIRGIAEASGNQLEEIVAINSRTEIMFKETPHLGECTALAATPEATASGHTLVGQNWDWMPKLDGHVLLLTIKQKGQEEKPTVLTYTEAGIVAKIGMNSAGLGLCVNLLVSDSTKVGLPFHILCRGILSSFSMGEALGKIFNHQTGASANYLIGHMDGEAIDIETNPSGVEYLYSQNGALSHANHFESRLPVPDEGRKIFPDTILRSCRSGKFLARQRGEICVETLQTILQDHFNYPNSICRHPDARAHELEQVQTNSSIVINLTERTMWICEGNPCKGGYTAVPLH